VTDPIHDHIRAVRSRPTLESRRLAAGLMRRCWPGGNGDRTEPAAREWVRLWGPTHAMTPPPVCSCETGRCRVCN
jgi:hypothetical protein